VPADREEAGDSTPVRARANFDWASTVMAAVTIVALLAVLWFRFGAVSKVKPLSVGDKAPLLRLFDLESREPLLVLGLKGKVVWIVFWRADASDAPQALAAIARASSTIRAHRRFSMFAAAVGAGKPDHVREVMVQSGVSLPVYLAGADSVARFGAEPADPPLHVLLDEDGQVMAMARGTGQSTLDRLADQARRRLDELDPHGTTRFAFR
jgi:hypothetical protein